MVIPLRPGEGGGRLDLGQNPSFRVRGSTPRRKLHRRVAHTRTRQSVSKRGTACFSSALFECGCAPRRVEAAHLTVTLLRSLKHHEIGCDRSVGTAYADLGSRLALQCPGSVSLPRARHLLAQPLDQVAHTLMVERRSAVYQLRCISSARSGRHSLLLCAVLANLQLMRLLANINFPSPQLSPRCLTRSVPQTYAPTAAPLLRLHSGIYSPPIAILPSPHPGRARQQEPRNRPFCLDCSARRRPIRRRQQSVGRTRQEETGRQSPEREVYVGAFVRSLRLS